MLRCIATQRDCGESWGPEAKQQATGLAFYAKPWPCDAKEIGMNTRALVLVTSLAVFWFRAFAIGAVPVQTEERIAGGKKVQAD